MTGADKLARLSAAERDTVLTLLDEMSRRLEPREMDAAFAKAGIARAIRRRFMPILAGEFDVIAVAARR